MPRLSFFSWALLLLVGVLMLPVLSVVGSWLQFDTAASDILREMAQTVLPDYALTSLLLCVSVALGVALVGMATASAVTLFEFPGRRIFEWALLLPLARPAVAAGVALALMETLADYGVASYFGIQTFTAGIYKAWLAMDNRIAAAQLATMLLVVVAVLLKLEHAAQKRMRFVSNRGGASNAADAAPTLLQGKRAALAWLVCALPIALGFVLPVLFMLRPLVQGWGTLPWAQFGGWAFSSIWLASLSAVLATLLAVLLGFAVRSRPSSLTRGTAQLASLGYAVPGAVIVVGMLIPVGWLQSTLPELKAGYWVTATALGIVWAYMVRFSAVALQSVQSGYTRIPGSLDDSARMLGTTGLGLLRRVHWPLLKRSVAVAALLVFVDVMKELPATLVLRPFNSDTLAVVAYQLARDERLGEAALPALALVLVGLLPVALISRTLRRK